MINMQRKELFQLGCQLSSCFLTNLWQFVVSTLKNNTLLTLPLVFLSISFSWTRNGTHFDIDDDPNVIMRSNSGTLVVDISRVKAEQYECVYQCTARNKHGTAVSNNIVVRQSSKSFGSPIFSVHLLISSFSPFLFFLLTFKLKSLPKGNCCGR